MSKLDLQKRMPFPEKLSPGASKSHHGPDGMHIIQLLS